MKISELIIALEKGLSKYGDLPFAVDFEIDTLKIDKNNPVQSFEDEPKCFNIVTIRDHYYD